MGEMKEDPDREGRGASGRLPRWIHLAESDWEEIVWNVSGIFFPSDDLNRD